MANMTSLFDGYDEEYQSITNDISKKISEVSTYETDPDKNTASLKQIGRLVGQANQLIDQMNLEVRSLEAATRKQLQKKVRQYKTSLNSLEDDYRRVREKHEREGLLGAGADGVGGLSAEHRSRMADTTERMQGSSRALEMAITTVQETEDVALGITDELGRNREKIISAHNKVRQTSSLTDTARSLVSRMTRRDKQHKCMMYGLMLFMLIAIIIALYYTMGGGGGGSDPVSTTSAPSP